MPYDVIKRSCRQSDGSKGTHVVVKKKSGGKTEQVSCHTSESKAKSAVRAKHANEGNTVRIKESDLRRIIAEEIRAVIKESIPKDAPQSPLPAKTVVTASDGNRHTVIIEDLYTGYRDDPSWGSVNYSIDGKDFNWEFHSGFHGEGAADHILGNLGDGFNDDLHDQLRDWLDKLELWRLQ